MTFLPGNALPSSHPLNDGLEYWWLGLPDLSGGGTAFDLSPFTRHSALAGASAWGSSPYGRILTFGEDDHVNLPSTLTVTGGWFVSVWFRITTMNLTNALFGDYGTTSDYVAISSSGERVRLVPAAATLDWTGLSIPADTWHHVAIGKRGSSTWYGWLNGRPLSGTKSSTNDLILDCFGEGRSSSGLVGDIRDFRIWSRPFDNGKVLHLYQDSLAGYPDTLDYLGLPQWAAATSGAAPAFGGTNQIIGGGMIGV